MPVTRPILWDIYEEHLGEAAWLWEQWEESLDSALYAIGDVAVGPEERLLAHLDGLVLGGEPVARKLLLPALGSDDLGEVRAATWALVQAEDADHQDAVFEAMAAAAPPVQAAMGRAVGLCPKADISRLMPLWAEGSPTVKAMVMDIFAPREPQWVRERIDPAFRGGQPPLIAAALRAVRRYRDREFVEHVRFALQYQQPEILRESLTTGLWLGMKDTWAVCRTVAAGQSDDCRLALGLLGISPDLKDRELVRGRAMDPGVARHALWALGFSADTKAADTLVQAMAKPEFAKVAGEAFAAITGLALVGDFARPGESVGPDVEEVKPEDPPPVVRPEDYLPEPRVETVAKWWEKARAGYHPVVRYVHGQPRNTEALRPTLASAATWRREILATELALSLVNPPQVELRNWAKQQLVQLAQAAKPAPVDRKLLAMHAATLKA